MADFNDRTIPLDVFVFDMNWHQKPSWGGYTFDTRLLPVCGLSSWMSIGANIAAALLF